MHFDELLKVLGELGHYQKTRLFLICLVSIVCAFHAMNMVFVGANPKKKCQIPYVNLSSFGAENVTFDSWISFLRKADEDACEIYNSDELLRYVTNGTYTFQELISSQTNVSFSKEGCKDWEFSRDVYGPTIVTQFYLVCNSAWLRSTSKTLYFFGRLLGAVIFGQLSDIFGRRPMFFAGLLMLLIVGCVAAASPSMFVFIPFYILQGAAQTGLFLVAFTMCTELVGPSYRVLAGFLVQGFYSIGYMALSGIAYLIYDWRYIELAITVPVVLFSVYLCVLPESIRWLLSKGREEQAKEIIKKVAKTNKVTITESMLEGLGVSKENPKEVIDDRKYTFVDLFRPFKMLTLSLNVWFNWLVNAMVYYGLALGTDNLGGDPYINFMIAGAVEIPAYIMCVLCLNRIGRKKPLTITMIFGGISCIASAFIPKDLVALKVTLAMLGKFGITASYAIIYLMAAEVFPTVVRNIGMGISSMSARIGGMLAPQILELGVLWAPLPLLVFGVLSAVAGLLALILPETNGRPLPQTIDDILHPDKLKHREDMTLDIIPNEKKDSEERV
ncbi:organic cation transporter protein-like [Saccostrea echinata]|uniref:organic cation transporter protein-like n=1 Tax=Saccostrea echinata TaxID=191078 RepID=UPI002A80CDA3|nr:organic cation transporter protein-like [Saccostrea echinata]XP_061176497.1 organic cation transporter protein-like [Saccostrea echinata]